MSKPNRLPSVCWGLTTADFGEYVMTGDDDTILCQVNESDGHRASLLLDRKTARLLAKRINQCLDATTVRALRKRGVQV